MVYIHQRPDALHKPVYASKKVQHPYFFKILLKFNKHGFKLRKKTNFSNVENACILNK